MLKRETRPVRFLEANRTLCGGATGAEDMPVYDDGGGLISCWKIPFWKRFKVLFTGCVWLHVSGRTHAPLYIETQVFVRACFWKWLRGLAKRRHFGELA